MTQAEKDASWALNRCSFLPGSFDKRFVRQLDNWHDREMTEKGRECMLRLLDKYRRQIDGAARLKERIQLERRIDNG